MSCRCAAIEDQFGPRIAERDLRRYRRHGPQRTAALLLEAVRSQGGAKGSLLDVGGGVGVLHHELLGSGVGTATNVEGSSAYLEAARAESERRGHAARVRFVHGDFVEVASELPAADVVTLDRVICCYPDFARLVTASVERCKRLYAASYPRDRWFVRLALAAENALRRLSRSDFRAYVHPTAAIESLVEEGGLVPCFQRATAFWQVAAWRRP